MAILPRELSPQLRGRESHEPLPKAIPHDMALSISFGMDTQVSVSHSGRGCRPRSRRLYSSLRRTEAMRDCGTECPVRSHSPDCDDSSQDRGFGYGRDLERSDRDSSIQSVRPSEAETLLGEPFLVERLLCGHRGSGRRDDPEVYDLNFAQNCWDSKIRKSALYKFKIIG